MAGTSLTLNNTGGFNIGGKSSSGYVPTQPSFTPTPQTPPTLPSSLSSFMPAQGSLSGLVNTNLPSSPSILPSTIPQITTTPKGGTSFNPSLISNVSGPASNPPTQPLTDAQEQGLAQFVTNNYQTPNGGTVTTSGGAGGNVTGYTPPAGYSIDTSGTIPSEALSGNTSMSDINSSLGNYQDLVNGVAQAQGYSPAYIAALQSQYGAQTQGAGLNLNQATINANAATGAGGFSGLGAQQAADVTGQQQALNTQQQGVNAIQQLGANQALNTQQLARTGAISAAQTQLQSSPTGMMGANQINSVNALSNQYPGAGILPTDTIEQAQQKVAGSSAYQAGFQSTYTTPGGGTGIYSKLDLSGLQQNSDGSYNLVPAAAAALGSANASVLNNQLGNLSTINGAIQSSTKTAQSMTAFMNQYGLNQSSVPIINQITNSANSQLNKAGAVAALNVDLNTLRSDYSQFLIGRGGSIAGTNDEAAQTIPDNISPSQLQTVIQQMQTDGQNTADAVSQQVNQAIQGISSNTVASTNGNSSTSSWPGWNP